jgi:acyl-CoA thioester hydrolase
MTQLEYDHTIRVRYADTDQMGVVYHARYFEWFEAARTEMLRSMGMPYEHMEKEGIFLPVIEAWCRYREPVRYDELVIIRTVLQDVSRLKIKLCYSIPGDCEGDYRAEGYTLHCFMNTDGKPIRASHELVSFFKGNPIDK